MIGSSAVASEIAELLGQPDRDALPATVEGVTNTFAALGVDVSEITGKLLRSLFPEVESVLMLNLGAISGGVSDEEIAVCYRQLRSAAESGDEEAYQRAMARLRELQVIEAREIRQSFEADKTVDRAHVGDALRRADELLARYENPPE